MARRRFFVESIRDDAAQLTGEEAMHLARVLRAEPGQVYEISDNARVYLAEVAEVSTQRVIFRVLESLPANEAPARITVLAALVKFDRFEWIIEKSTELGADAILPVEAARSEKGLLEAARKRIPRWVKIARESSQQSRRARMLQVRQPKKLKDALLEPAIYRYFLEERTGAPPIFEALPEPPARSVGDAVALLAGPEGGWTDQEREEAFRTGWNPLSLGPHILRTETAVIAALAVIMNAWWERFCR
jgi:16S rRNA (uracil1498-N3)-methyltransferase